MENIELDAKAVCANFAQTAADNRLRIDSARQKDLAALAEDIDMIKKELGSLRKRWK